MGLNEKKSDQDENASRRNVGTRSEKNQKIN